MLTTASQFGPRARFLRTNHATATATATFCRVLGASGPLTLQQCQQTREFRFVSWFSHLDSEIQKKIRRQEQTLKQTYLDRCRHPDLDNHPLANEARHAVKRMMASYWLSHDACPRGGREDAGSKKQRTPDNKHGRRPGQNIQDVERGAMEHLIFGKGEEDPARGPKLKRKRGGKKNKHNSIFHAVPDFPEEQGEYFIDPVTNRRVSKHPAPTSTEGGVDIPVKTFKDYRTRLMAGYDGPSDITRSDELRRRRASRVEAEPTTEYSGAALGTSAKLLRDGIWRNERARAQDSKPKHDDLHKYKPVLDEGQVSSEGPQQPYADLDKYRPATDKEPVLFQDLKPSYEDLDKYNAAVVDQMVDRLESNKAPYSDLHRYNQETAPEHALDEDAQPNHNDLEKLRSGFSVDDAAEQTEIPPPEDDLDDYRLWQDDEPHGKPPGPQTTVVRTRILEIPKPLLENLEPGDFPPSTVKQLREKYGTAELRAYTAWGNVEPKQNSSSSAAGRVAAGPTGKYEPEELAKHSSVCRNEPDGKPPTATDELSKIYTDLVRYGAVREGLEEMDAKMDYGSPVRLGPEELDKADESSAEVLRRIRQSVQLEKDSEEANRRHIMESQMEKYQAASDATDHEASLAVRSARARAANTESERQLTGNYVRDFPEEFERSWTETLSTAPTETVQSNDGFLFESQNMDGGLEGAFGRPSPAKIQPALDRHLDDQPHMETASKEVGSEGFHSNSAQEADTMNARENIGTPTPPAHVKIHHDMPASANQGMSPTSPDTIHREPATEPTLYKILAYDPTMQKIEIAETSSFVPDTASALTPADALLRLSHPTRFFPHFGPLQAEGYEIISGTGDVLVFRKVRAEITKGRPAEQPPVPEQPAQTADEYGAVETRINPIDMTGRPRFSPASANFASPTGYVNYENIPETTASKLPPPPPRIKYNIDVHREEPVFSGPKARTDDKRGKRRGLGKRLIVGGVWVAGISYALGVISEYFTTGGLDGMGPQGL